MQTQFEEERDKYMNQLLNKMERKFGRYAIPDMIRYIVILYCLGGAISLAGQLGMIDSMFYYKYLSLNMNEVFHGQVWRLVTYLVEPYGFSSGGGLIIDLLFFFIQVNLFFLFGRSLEQAWGTFRFNFYIFTGIVLNIVAALVLYLSPLHFEIYDSGLQYIYWAMFFAFAMYNPNMEFLLYFVIPIKVKWLAILDAALLIYSVISSVRYGIAYMMAGYVWNAQCQFSTAIAIVIAMGNFLLFFFATRDFQRIRPKEVHRRRQFKKQMHQESPYGNGARHRCAVCGRTELDAPNLDFRYCSKCEGNYEYCSEHLFTHQHVKKFM